MEKIKWGSEPEYFGPRHYYRESLLINHINKNLKEGSILDAGFGNGSLSLRLSKGNYNIIGIDLSQEFIDYASEKIQSPKIKLKKGDITNLDFKNNTFDGIVCSEVLEHIEEEEEAIKEFYRTLKEDGKLFISVPANPKLWDKSDEWAGHKRRYTKNQLKKLLEANGFKIIKIHYWGFPLTRLYHRKIYLKTLNNQKLKKTKLKKYSKYLSNIFKIDNLFNNLPLGIGLIVVAQK
jgi:2-polyprenyl-3-methyl-5-hydroxy-6-metoxy-1,4-benzoquinol methylase